MAGLATLECQPLRIKVIKVRSKEIPARLTASFGATLGLLVSACSGPQSALDPASPAAELIANLWWVMLIVASLVTALVLVLLLIGLTRGAGEGPARPLDERKSRRLVIAGGIILPIVVTIPFVISSFSIGRAVDAPPEDALTIEVEGRLWWWEVHYLDPDGRRMVTTANEIHIPVGKPVRVVLTTDNVIHSFWVPELTGKVDMIPGRPNTLALLAQEPGIYRGQCAEFCGEQHALMAFFVVAEPPEQFATWLEYQTRPAGEPTTPEAILGKKVFLTSGCSECHTIRGTEAAGELGPDLTHLASRGSLAAGTVPNTVGHLGGWIADPQHIKPEAFMPPTVLPPDQLKALIIYLESLE